MQCELTFGAFFGAVGAACGRESGFEKAVNRSASQEAGKMNQSPPVNTYEWRCLARDELYLARNDL